MTKQYFDMVYVGVAICSYMCMQVHDNANKISTIPRQCHPAAITQMVMDGLRYTLGDATWSERGQRPCLLVCIDYIPVVQLGFLYTMSLNPSVGGGTVCERPYVSGSEKRDHFALNVDFKLVILSHSTVDGLSVAVCCTSIAAPVPKIRSLKVRKYAQCNYEKTARNPSVIISVNMATT